jgi:hypothetical protein
MKRPDENPDLEQAFAALRRREQGAEPSFANLWAAAQARRRARPERPFRPFLLAATAAAAGMLAVFLALWRVPPPGAQTISQWRPTTEFLLQFPGRELLGAAPRLGRGFDLAAPPSTSDHPRRPS